MAKSEDRNPVVTTEDVDKLLAIIANQGISKSSKEAALGKIREIEARTGTRIYGNYCGPNAGPICRNSSELARMEEENDNS